MYLQISSVSEHPVRNAFFVLVAIPIVAFCVELYKKRRRSYGWKKRGLPMPPWNPLFGNIPTLIKVMSKIPRDAHGHYAPYLIRKAFPDLNQTFYLDAWPLGPQMLVVGSVETAYQVTQENSQPKHPSLREYMLPLTGGNDLVSQEGQTWKRWRNIFNAGFALSHLITLAPGMVEEVEIFCEKLGEHADRGEVFQMEEETTGVTSDVIGKVAIDTRFNSQRSKHPFVMALRNQASWLVFSNEIHRFHPFRPFTLWWNRRVMDKFLYGELERRIATYEERNAQTGSTTRSRTIIDLALDTYLLDESTKKSFKKMDTTFKDVAMNQLKVFLFAGHDTTSSTLSYVYYLLSKNPSCLARIRTEYDFVFGPDSSEIASLIASNPQLLNRLPYTTAVIKETLRLFPVAATPRYSPDPNHTIWDSSGHVFPTEGCIILVMNQCIQRDSKYWPSPNEFLPQRWLASPGEPLYPEHKGAWRPFEYGPRNCIGQEMALLEIKITLAMTLRRFDVVDAFEEWDRRKGRTGVRTVDGERAYQVLVGTAHMVDGFPARVVRR